MLKLYGIKNCDTVKKAIKQLELQQIPYTFIDLKTTELPTDLLHDWLGQFPNKLVNKRSITYRSVKSAWLLAEKNGDVDAQIALIKANPILIKRPVIQQVDGTIVVGFDLASYQAFA